MPAANSALRSVFDPNLPFGVQPIVDILWCFSTPSDERWAAAFKSQGVDPRLLSSETGAA